MAEQSQKSGVRAKKFGTFLSRMIMPNIAAFNSMGDYYSIIYRNRLAAKCRFSSNG